MSAAVGDSRSEAERSLEPARLSRRVGQIMRVGILGASTFWFVGLVLYGLNGTPVDFTSGTALPLGNLLEELVSLNPLAYFLLGFVFLVASPITRVIVSILHFERVGDADYVVLTSTVLALLVATIVIGLIA
jgi:uncharacterized membrane protein